MLAVVCLVFLVDGTLTGFLCRLPKVGQPHYFVSHSWGGNFMDMVRRIKSELKDENPENVYLWIDMFSLNLHHKDRTAFKRVQVRHRIPLPLPGWPPQASLPEDPLVISSAGCSAHGSRRGWRVRPRPCALRSLHTQPPGAPQDAMLVSKRGTLAVLEPSATMVSCCLYEIWATVHYRGLHLLKFVANNPAAPVEWDAAVRELDLFACKPTKQRDRGAALKAVCASCRFCTIGGRVHAVFMGVAGAHEAAPCRCSGD